MFQATAEVASLALGGKSQGTPEVKPIETAEQAKAAFEMVFNGK